MSQPLPAPDASEPSRRWSVLRELPWILAVGAGIVMLAWRTLDAPSGPQGSDWAQYVKGAMFLHDPSLVQYPDWRRPLYMALMELLGGARSYLDVGRAISQVASGVGIFAAALGARALRGPAAAVGAALILPWIPPFAEGSLWVTPYALLAACTGLALAFGACSYRWGSLWAAGLAGFSAGLACATDTRGVSVVPAALLLVLLGWKKLREPRRALASVLVALLALGAVHQLTQQYEARHGVQRLSFDNMLLVQRQGTLEQVAWVDWLAPLREVCRDVQPTPLTAGELLSPCAQAMLRHNTSVFQGKGMLPGTATLLLVLATLIPLRRAPLRSVAASLALFGVPLAAYVAGASWVTYSARYILPACVPLAMLIPVALTSAAGLLPRPRWLGVSLQLVGLAGALAWAWYLWPAPRVLPPEPDVTADAVAVDVATWLERHLGPDDLVIDCAGLSPTLVIAPRVLQNIQEFPPQDEVCRQRILAPPVGAGDTWLLTHGLQADETDSPVTPNALLEGAGWVLVHAQGDAFDHRAWRWPSGAPPAPPRQVP